MKRWLLWIAPIFLLGILAGCDAMELQDADEPDTTLIWDQGNWNRNTWAP